ncbi:Ribosome assembly protein 3 [Nakaseomyces glabratus]|nr:Ribosome assembly protein 3 [Nakaseomyces glabratus]KTB16246.1 Ribosome assembly protein 3 [Nakaseomyces glabratus]
MPSQEIFKTKQRKSTNRRRKKRRTAESESDSDSSSSSAASDIEMTNEEEKNDNNNPIISDVELSDLENESEKRDVYELDKETKNKLANIPLTRTEFTSRKDKSVPINLNAVQNKLEMSEEQLKDRIAMDQSKEQDAYLNLMFENFGDELNAFRTASDFNSKTVNILANVLKDGTALFDNETLKSIVKSQI